MLSAVVVGLRTLALLPMHAHRGQAFQGVTPSFHLSNYQLSKQRYFVVCPLTFYRQRTSRTLPERIVAGSIAGRGVFDEIVDQLQYLILHLESHNDSSFFFPARRFRPDAISFCSVAVFRRRRKTCEGSCPRTTILLFLPPTAGERNGTEKADSYKGRIRKNKSAGL